MAAAIPTQEPNTITAGDTAKWKRCLVDYSAADGWVLSYSFRKEGDGQLINFSATASGPDHLVNVLTATTLTWAAGDYNGQAYVSKSGERFRVWQGRITILPDFTTQEVDTRSQAKIILDYLDEVFEKVSRKQTINATVEGVSLQLRSMDELIKARNYWGTIYAKEQRIRSGRQERPVILTQFTRPR